MSLNRGPIVTRNPDGTVFMTLPDPPALDYPVSTELLREWVATINENVALRSRIDYLRGLIFDDLLCPTCRYNVLSDACHCEIRP